MFHVKHWRWFHWLIPVPVYSWLEAYRNKRDLEQAQGRSFTWEEFHALTATDHAICPGCQEIVTGIQLAAGHGLCDACYQAHHEAQQVERKAAQEAALIDGNSERVYQVLSGTPGESLDS
jgi:hypothetical protein